MKKHLLLAFSAITIILASSFVANDCSSFEQFTKGVNYITTNYDAKGKVTSSVDCTVKEVTTTVEKTVADINVIMKDADGKSTDTADYSLTCTGSAYLMDLKGMGAAAGGAAGAKGMNVVIEGEMLEYPVTMSAGQSLPGGTIILKMYSEGNLMSTTTINIHDRKCEKVENKTTTAGTWECYKITYIMDGTINMGVMKMPVPARAATEWFSFKVGAVRTETYKKDKLEGYSELTKFTKP